MRFEPVALACWAGDHAEALDVFGSQLHIAVRVQHGALDFHGVEVGGVGGGEEGVDTRTLVQCFAVEADHMLHVPVQRNDVFGAGLGVQPVDVLRDDAADQARTFQLNEGKMRTVGLCLAHEAHAHERAGPVAVHLSRRVRELLERHRAALGQAAVFTAVVRDTGVCGDARAGDDQGFWVVELLEDFLFCVFGGRGGFGDDPLDGAHGGAVRHGDCGIVEVGFHCLRSVSPGPKTDRVVYISGLRFRGGGVVYPRLYYTSEQFCLEGAAHAQVGN